jgi:beta-aspartyl-dipeptidase (metallo-type)
MNGREDTMITLIKNGQVFAPEPLGVKDVLIAGGRLAAVRGPGSVRVSGTDMTTIDASGKYVVPGLIDTHVHILGGGGEGGPATRAPEIRVEDIIGSGVTTLVGCLGTDGTTRHMESLLAKARGLEAEGISTFIYSGSYEVPVRTFTGSVRTDLILIDKVIGAGEIAVSDHRSSQPTFEEFARLAAECRVGGMLGGKAGILHCHLGDGPRKLDYFFRLIGETEIPPTQVMPTHINRNRELFEEGIRWIKAGGFVDLTTGPDPDPAKEPDVSIEDCARLFQESGVPVERWTVSSDSNGSFPVFDKSGKLIALTIASQKDLFRKFLDVVRKGLLKLEDALRPFATNATDFYKLARKGRIAEGLDADVLILNENLELDTVIAGGRRMMENGKVIARGTFSA